MSSQGYVRADLVDRRIAEAVEAERERCARMAENTDVSGTLAPKATIAAAIRSHTGGQGDE
ncbi:hypothetical protein [Tropicimonas sp. IMCC34011]|uniref:hypothetical protein n=1 Tax=Tropicimonas sp. IMCC34011 TaxID=2248759 RepID=UPI000E268C5F|nr:hypothetical protein [Tropicimonas sp. IMCC34011]